MSTVNVVDDVKGFRKGRNETQIDFWGRFGLTQPGGSRYENGQKLPTPTAILLELFADGTLTVEKLEQTVAKVKQSGNVVSE